METKFGYTIIEWENGKEELRNICIEVAKKQRTIFYSDVARKILSIAIEPSSHALADMLGEISKNENEADRGMLSAVVIGKENNIPGKGFFTLARTLGRNVFSDDEFWIEELKRVYDYWRES